MAKGAIAIKGIGSTGLKGAARPLIAWCRLCMARQPAHKVIAEQWSHECSLTGLCVASQYKAANWAANVPAMLPRENSTLVDELVCVQSRTSMFDYSMMCYTAMT